MAYNIENLIGNSKNMTDFLGNYYEYDCLGCSIGIGHIIPPGGIIYEDETWILTTDPEIPLNGFLILAPKFHVNSLVELSKEDRYKMMDIASFAISKVKELGLAKQITLVQEERSKHFHLWIFPNSEWMIEKFGKGVSFVRDICAYARENATLEEKEEIVKTVKVLKEAFDKDFKY